MNKEEQDIGVCGREMQKNSLILVHFGEFECDKEWIALRIMGSSRTF